MPTLTNISLKIILVSNLLFETSWFIVWFWQFFLKKIISRAEFDELCYFGTQNPWNFGENCKRIGLNSKNLSIKLIITDDIYWHIFSLCTAECFEGHPLTTRIFLAWLGMIGTETLVCKNYQSWNHLITYTVFSLL